MAHPGRRAKHHVCYRGQAYHGYAQSSAKRQLAVAEPCPLRYVRHEAWSMRWAALGRVGAQLV